MKLKSILAMAFVFALSVSTALAAQVVKGDYYDFNRSAKTGFVISNNNRGEIAPNAIPAISNNLLVSIEGYNLYMDVPAWMSALHTKNEVEKGKNGSSFSYNIKNPYEGIQVQVVKGVISPTMKSDLTKQITSSLPAVGSKLSNGGVFTKAMLQENIDKSLDLSMLYNLVMNYAEYVGNDYVSININPVHLEKGYGVLENSVVAANPKNKMYTDGTSLLMLNGSDLIIFSISYGKNITPQEKAEVQKAILTANFN